MQATQNELNVAEALDFANELFKVNGLRIPKLTYNALLGRYGSFLFKKIAFCQGISEILEFRIQASEWSVNSILYSWFEDNALIKAGFKFIVDERDKD